MKRWFIATAVFVLWAFLGAASAATLRVGSDITYPPFEFVDEITGQYTGFDIDLIKAIADAMDVDVEINHVAWDRIFDGLNNGEYDVVISSVTITPERSLLVDFSDPYFVTGQVVVVRSNEQRIAGPSDLSGKTVAVQAGTTSFDAARAIPGVSVRTFEVIGEAFDALRRGEVDAVLSDHLPAASEVRARPGLKVAGRPFTVEQYGIAVRKGESELLGRINAALAKLVADGTYQAIFEKWFAASWESMWEL